MNDIELENVNMIFLFAANIRFDTVKNGLSEVEMLTMLMMWDELKMNNVSPNKFVPTN